MSAVYNTNNNSNRQFPGEDEETVEATEDAEQAPVESTVESAEEEPVAQADAVQSNSADEADEAPAAEDDDVRTIYSESLATLVSGLDDDAMSTVTEGKQALFLPQHYIRSS